MMVQKLRTDQDTLFFEMLVAKRRAMRPSTRERNKTLDLKGFVWRYPMNIEREYSIYISSLMRQYTRIATPYILDNYTSWANEFRIDGFRKDNYEDDLNFLNQQLEQTQEEMFSGYPESQVAREIQEYGFAVHQYNLGQWEKFTRIAIGEAFVPSEPWVIPVINVWGQTNYDLLKSLSDEYIKKTNLIVQEGVQFGKTRKQISEELSKNNKEITGYRSRLIARDQIGKLNAQLTERRQVQSGIDFYEWITSRDERVRATHKEMQGTLNKWDDSTVYSKDNGQTFIKRPTAMQGLIPGQDIQCRCESVPNIDNLIAEADQLIMQEAA